MAVVLVAQAFQPAGLGDFPVARHHKHGTGKSREPAGWKACATSSASGYQAAFVSGSVRSAPVFGLNRNAVAVPNNCRRNSSINHIFIAPSAFIRVYLRLPSLVLAWLGFVSLCVHSWFNPTHWADRQFAQPALN